jgi:hypothetical protein
MPISDNNWEPRVTFGKTCGICIATSCPLDDNVSEAENVLKTKDRKRRFCKNEAENILKLNQLPKTVETQNLGDKLFGQVEVGTRNCGLGREDQAEMRRYDLDPLTRPASAGESAGCSPPSPISGVRWTPSGS